MIDRATRENGCLQVLAGSHLMGRVEHAKSGEQTGADLERVEVALHRFPLVFVELPPGGAIFFHANLLHRSEKNCSDNPRWALICCYNTRRNDPYKPSRHPGYHALVMVDDEEVMAAGARQLQRMREG